MAGTRDWFKHDAWFLADDKIRDLGHEFGPAGPLVAEALLELAKRQKAAGNVTVKWSYLAEHAFAKSRNQVRQIVAASEGLGFIRITESDDRDLSAFVVKWPEIQGSGVSGAERTAAWRDRKEQNGDDDVTSRNGHGDDAETSPRGGARAVAQEEERETEEAKASSRRRSADDVENEKASDEDRQLCRLLAEQMKGHNPKVKVKSQSSWLRSMRLSREQDGNSPAETERLIRWMFEAKSKQSAFWATVIQSPANLREHFAQMWAQMLAEGQTNGHGSVESSTAFLARRGAA